MEINFLELYSKQNRFNQQLEKRKILEDKCKADKATSEINENGKRLCASSEGPESPKKQKKEDKKKAQTVVNGKFDPVACGQYYMINEKTGKPYPIDIIEKRIDSLQDNQRELSVESIERRAAEIEDEAMKTLYQYSAQMAENLNMLLRERFAKESATLPGFPKRSLSEFNSAAESAEEKAIILPHRNSFFISTIFDVHGKCVEDDNTEKPLDVLMRKFVNFVISKYAEFDPLCIVFTPKSKSSEYIYMNCDFEQIFVDVFLYGLRITWLSEEKIQMLKFIVNDAISNQFTRLRKEFNILHNKADAVKEAVKQMRVAIEAGNLEPTYFEEWATIMIQPDVLASTSSTDVPIERTCNNL